MPGPWTDSRIDDTQPDGQHIDLACVNHPNLRWHTKNIGWRNPDTKVITLARTLFFDWDSGARECTCPTTDLRLLGDMPCATD